MGQPVTWFELGADAERRDELAEFHRSLFGWTVEPVPGMDYSIISTNGGTTAGEVGGGITGASGGPGVVVYVEVDDLDAALKEAERLGGRVTVPVTEVPDMVTFAQFADPAGNPVGLVLASPPETATAGEEPTRWVLLYESADDVLTRAPVHYAAHRARLEEFRERGLLLSVGVFGDPQAEGSMAVFTTREAAEEFVADDPFRRNGVVRSYQLREWQLAW